MPKTNSPVFKVKAPSFPRQSAAMQRIEVGEVSLINQGLEETVQKRTHDLIVLKQQTDNLIEYAPDAMIVSDEAGDIIRVNYETERLFGYRREELLGNSILMLLHNDVDNDFIAQLHHVFNMTIAERMTHNEIHEYAGVTKFDDFVPIAVNFNAITHDHEQAIIVCAIRDITAEKLAQQALREALTQAQAADRVKTQFLTTMSHEMRTPMNGVLGMAELLSQTGMSEQQKQYLNTILDTGRSLLTIINDVLDFSQLESGNANIKINTINLAELLKMVISLVEPSAKQKSLTLSYHVDENCAPFIEGDAGRIRQVLLHYVGNAVKFTEVGSITLSVAKITIKDTNGHL
jgi:PAS domain S-box-containing protein